MLLMNGPELLEMKISVVAFPFLQDLKQPYMNLVDVDDLDRRDVWGLSE